MNLMAIIGKGFKTDVSEIDADTWDSAVKLLKYGVTEPKLESEEDVLGLAEDADFLFLELANYNKPTEKMNDYFQSQRQDEPNNSTDSVKVAPKTIEPLRP